MSISSRQRVLETIKGKKTDRIPADFAAVQGVAEKYMQKLGIREYEDFLQMLEVDMRRVGGYTGHILPDSEPDEQGFITNMWGVKRKETGPSIGSGAMYGPFDETTTLENVENHDWPDPDVLDFSYVRQECQNHHENYAVYGSPWCHFFHEAADMFGQENFLVFMYTKPEIVKAAIDKIVDFEIEATRRFLDAAEGLIDITFFGNDFGTQRGLFISPELWEKFIRPVVKKFIDISHDYQCRVMLHSCGSIRDIIPALIEDGVDLLDPVQTRAKEMDLPGLLNDFGGKITFHGGIDTQHTLPFGTTQDVKNEVDSYVSQAKKHGSYILASSQEFTEDIPLQNVLEMYKPKYRNLSA